MKQVIAFILMPLRFILISFQKMFELVVAFSELIGEPINEIIEANYKYWAKIFKWKDDE